MPTGRPDPLSIAAGTGRYSGIAGPTSVQASLGLLWVVDGSSGFSTVQRDLALSYSVSGAAPAPPPAPGVTIASVTLLTPAGPGEYAVRFGHNFRPGDLNGEYLDGVQTDVTSRWPDRSVQHAIISAVFTSTGTSTTLALGKGKPLLGNALTIAQLKALGHSLSITTDAYGSAVIDAGSADWDTPYMTWVSGPRCLSVIYRKQIGSDAHLTAWWNVDYFSNGLVAVLPWIENGYLSVASPTAKPGTYTANINGTAVFGPMSLPVWHHTRQPLINGTKIRHWVGGIDKTVIPKHDFAYIEGTGVTVPTLPAVERNLPAFPSYGGVSANFTPYEDFTPETTMFSTNMGSAGGADSIGLQSGWDIVAQVDNSALGYTQLIRESYRFGQCQIHYRDEATNKPIRFSTRSGMQLRIGEADSLVNIYNREDGGLTSTPAIVGSNGAPGTTDVRKWARSHQPASPLLAYYLSGDFWFMEECQHIAAANFLSTAWTRQSSPQHHVCRPVRTPARMQMREAAWCFRNLVYALAATRDDDPLKAEYAASVDYNIDYYHDRYAPGVDMPEGLNPLGLIEHEGNGPTGGDQAWQYDFWVMTWAKVIMLRVGSATEKRVKARAFFDWVSRSIVGRAGGTGPTEHPARWIGTSFNTYDPDGAGPAPNQEYSALFPGSNPAVYPNWARTPGNGPWWNTWGDYFNWSATQQGYTGGRTDGAIAGGYSGDATGWTIHGINALRLCASLGAPGAVAAMARVEATADFSWWTSRSSGIWGGDTRPTNAYATRTLPLADLVAESYRPPVSQRGNVNLNSLSDADFDQQTTFSQAERWWNGYSQSNSLAGMLGYSGSIWASGYGPKGAIIIKGGGHGYNIAQMAYPFNIDGRRWEQVGAPKNLPANLEWAGWSNYANSGTWTAGMDQRVISPLWYDYNHNGSFIKFDEHSYLQTVYLSPAEGGASIKGSLLLPQTTFHQGPETSDPRTGVAVYWSPSLFDLMGGRVTRAASAPYGTWNAYTSTIAVKDTTRNRVWYLRNATAAHFYIEPAGGTPHARVPHTAQKISGGNMTWTVVNNSTWLYVPEADSFVGFYPQNSNEAPPAIVNALLGVQILKLDASGFPVDQERDAAVGTRAMPFGGMLIGAAWVPGADLGTAVGRFYLYEGYGDDFCYTLTPSTLDFGTCSWTWGRERFTNAHTGADPVYRRAFTTGDGQIFAPTGKLVYVPADKCLAWHDGPGTGPRQCADGVSRTGIVQYLRVPGTPI